MRLHIFIPLAFTLFIGAVTPALSQDVNRSLEAITDLNRMDPLQNPGFETDEDILDRHILDSKNKVVGEVQDIILDARGRVLSLNAEFDRLNLSTPVYLNFETLDITSRANAYGLAFEEEQISALYPELLADIQSASGTEENTYSLKKLKKARVKSADGRNLGQVDKVMFDSRGRRAVALYIAMKFGVLRGQGVAVPFTMTDQKGSDLIVSDELADAMVAYAREK